jgi:AcrR family transcriptional regulator
MTRAYRMKVRADRHAETRRRIVEAAVRVQQMVGPRRATVSQIARMAGVERPTVLRHFGDRLSLLSACTSGDPTPDAAAWESEADPEVRLFQALSETYAWFRRNRALLGHLLEMLEGDDSLASLRDAMWQQRNLAHRVVAEGWRVPDSNRPNLVLAVRHSLSFWTWRSLAESGLTDHEAARRMVDLVGAVASGQIWTEGKASQSKRAQPQRLRS